MQIFARIRRSIRSSRRSRRPSNANVLPGLPLVVRQPSHVDIRDLDVPVNVHRDVEDQHEAIALVDTDDQCNISLQPDAVINTDVQCNLSPQHDAVINTDVQCNPSIQHDAVVNTDVQCNPSIQYESEGAHMADVRDNVDLEHSIDVETPTRVDDTGPGTASSQLESDIEYLYDVHRRHYTYRPDPFAFPSLDPFEGETIDSKEVLIEKIEELKVRFQDISRQWSLLEADIAVFGFADGKADGWDAEKFRACRDESMYECGMLERDTGCMLQELGLPNADLGAVQDRILVFFGEANRLSDSYTEYWGERLEDFRRAAVDGPRRRLLQGRRVTWREPVQDIVWTPPVVAPGPRAAPRGFRIFPVQPSQAVVQEDHDKVTEI